MYDHVKSINSVTTVVHEDTVKNGLLTDISYAYCQVSHFHCNPVLLSLRGSPCPRGPLCKSLPSSLKSLSSRTTLQVVALEPQVLVLEDHSASPCPCPRASSPCPRALSPCPRAQSPCPWASSPCHCPQALSPCPCASSPCPRALSPWQQQCIRAASFRNNNIHVQRV